MSETLTKNSISVAETKQQAELSPEELAALAAEGQAIVEAAEKERKIHFGLASSALHSIHYLNDKQPFENLREMPQSS